VSFIFQLRDSGVSILACDCPDFNTLTLGIFASFAQYERERIADRTKAALQKKRDRDGEWRVSNLPKGVHVKGGEARKAKAAKNENNMRARAFLANLEKGLSLRQMAAVLNDNGFRTAGHGKNKPPGLFHATSVARLLKA
jgi:DNA invertase Pin-like site-specific DNA recombinase